MNLGNTIKRIRKNQGLTQLDLAIRCGITQTYLSQIESNSKEPNLSTLKMISSKIDVPLPIIFFLSMNEDDILPEKRPAFEILQPSLKNFIDGYYKI